MTNGCRQPSGWVDQCLTNWTENSRDELKTLVLDAFQVDQAGRLNTARHFGFETPFHR